jgi:hypothetical protein
LYLRVILVHKVALENDGNKIFINLYSIPINMFHPVAFLKVKNLNNIFYNISNLKSICLNLIDWLVFNAKFSSISATFYIVLQTNLLIWRKCYGWLNFFMYKYKTPQLSSCGSVALMVLGQFSDICGSQILENWQRTTRAMGPQLQLRSFYQWIKKVGICILKLTYNNPVYIITCSFKYWIFRN